MKEIIFASANEGKVKEIREICKGFYINVLSLRDYFDPIPDIPEIGTTFGENAIIKAKWVYDKTGKLAFADDSGLEVDFLNGAPGIYSARYSGIHGDNAANNRKLLKELGDLPLEDRTARYVCSIALIGDNIYEHFQETCEGIIGFEEIGNKGFGYDPLFYPSGYNNTFGQLNDAVKNIISHRAKAMKILKIALANLWEEGKL